MRLTTSKKSQDSLIFNEKTASHKNLNLLIYALIFTRLNPASRRLKQKDKSTYASYFVVTAGITNVENIDHGELTTIVR
jgi:hypothetical protein